MATGIPKASPYSRLIGSPTSPTPGFVQTHYPVVATTAVCLLLHSERVTRLLGSLHSVFALLQLPRFPALSNSSAASLVCLCLHVAWNSDNVFATSNVPITKPSRLSGVYTPKFAYDSLPLFQLIHHSTASTAVAWWKGLGKGLRTACTAVFHTSLHLLGNLRAVSTTANIIFWDIANIEAHPLLPPIIASPVADALPSPRRHPPLPPIITPPDTDTWQLPAYLRARPPLPPIFTPPDTDASSCPKLPHCFSAQFALATLSSKLGRPSTCVVDFLWTYMLCAFPPSRPCVDFQMVRRSCLL